jgi:hypothetical protein
VISFSLRARRRGYSVLEPAKGCLSFPSVV